MLPTNGQKIKKMKRRSDTKRNEGLSNYDIYNLAHDNHNFRSQKINKSKKRRHNITLSGKYNKSKFFMDIPMQVPIFSVSKIRSPTLEPEPTETGLVTSMLFPRTSTPVLESIKFKPGP